MQAYLYPSGVHDISDSTNGVLSKITMLSERCRIVCCSDLQNENLHYLLSFQIKQGGNPWRQIMNYEIGFEESWRLETTVIGFKKKSPIHLPPSLAKQMAHNDITRNWRAYAEPFFCNHLPSVRCENFSAK